MSTIGTEEWRAELDKVILSVPGRTPVITDHGFTIQDIAERRGVQRNQASDILNALCKQGKVKHIGWRGGQNPSKVFSLVTKE